MKKCVLLENITCWRLTKWISAGGMIATAPPAISKGMKASRRTTPLSAPAEAFVRLAFVALLTSQLERDETFTRRAERMEALVGELRERTALVARGGGEKAVERHRSRGKLTARERIDRLLDPGTALLELNALAAWELYDGAAPSAGIVTGIGVVEGQECVVVANDATVKGGSYFPLTVKKHLRAQEVASRTTSRASTSSTRAARSCRCRPMRAADDASRQQEMAEFIRDLERVAVKLEELSD